MASCGIDLADAARRRRSSRASATAASAGSPPASSTRWRPCAIPGVGYGIRYEYGIFRQTFVDGRQVEQPDTWLALGSPWEFPHPEMRGQGPVRRPHRARTRTTTASTRTRWVPRLGGASAIPYNYMVPGYRTGSVNTLRLWSARATQAFDLQVFNTGDYLQAVRAQAFAENISKVLYPEDSTPQGKELRLQQQYFFVACSLRDFIDNVAAAGLRPAPAARAGHLPAQRHPPGDRHPRAHADPGRRAAGWTGTRPGTISRQCFAYTCHTLLPEALEVWPVELLGRLLPRHLEIIYRINDEFLAELREAYPDDELRVRRMSIIQEHPERAVRMAYLATVAGVEGQRRRRAALPAAAGQGAARLLRATGRTSSPTSPTASPRAGSSRLANPGLSGADHRHHRRRLADRPGPAARAGAVRRRRRRSCDAFAAVKTANKPGWPTLLQRRDGIVLPDGRACST